MEAEIAQMAALGVFVYIGLAAVLGYLAWSWEARTAKRDTWQAIDEVLHPNGRCTCGFEGQCAWCIRSWSAWDEDDEP